MPVPMKDTIAQLRRIAKFDTEVCARYGELIGEGESNTL